MKKHIMLVHEAKKPFKCEVCGYRCALKITMSRLTNMVHEGKKPYKCGICDKEFAQ